MLSNTNTTTADLTGITSSTNTFIDTPVYLRNTDSSNPWQGVTASDNNFTIKNNNDMNVQAKIAIFEVTRNDKGIINSSIFKLEFWIEKKNGVSIDLAAAKYLPDDFDPDLIIVKELYSSTF